MREAASTGRRSAGPGRLAGAQDLVARREELAERLPEPLAPLARLAYNYRWSWLPGGPELFAAVDRERFELCLQNPVRLLQEASSRALAPRRGRRGSGGPGATSSRPRSGPI